QLLRYFGSDLRNLSGTRQHPRRERGRHRRHQNLYQRSVSLDFIHWTMKPLRKRSERGNAMLEFALGFTILWLMFAGVYQIGYSYYVYNVLMTSAANAAQLGSVLNYDVVDDVSDTGPYKTALKNMVVYGDEVAG